MPETVKIQIDGTDLHVGYSLHQGPPGPCQFCNRVGRQQVLTIHSATHADSNMPFVPSKDDKGSMLRCRMHELFLKWPFVCADPVCQQRYITAVSKNGAVWVGEGK